MEQRDLHIVSDVQNSFSEIEKSIESLKQCSNKDFKRLATCFNQSVKSVGTLIDYAKSVFSIVKEESSGFLIAEIRNVFEENEAILKRVRTFYLKIAELKSNSDFMQNLFLVYVENSMQDLKTFIFLSDGIIVSDEFKDNGNVLEVIRNMTECASDTIQNLKKLYIIHNKFRDQFECFLDFFNDESFQTLGFIDEPFVEAEREFSRKQILVKENYSAFSLRESSHSNVFSEIVTNLQYNDIITQKIEHVSEIITNVSVRLKHVKIGESSIELALPDVKKVVELQSAQLVQINVDYQEAVKVIFKRLEELSDNASDISLLTHSFCSKHGKSKSYFADLSQHLVLPEKYFPILDTAQHRMNDLIQNTQDLFVELDETHRHILSNVNAFNRFREQIEDGVMKNDSSSRIIAIKVNENMLFIQNSLTSFTERLLSVFKSDPNKSFAPLNQLKSSYESLMMKIDSLDVQVHHDITEASKISVQLQTNMNSLLKSVTYYSMFDNEIGFISKEMNRIVQILQGSTEDMTVDSEFFKSLKNYYTMKSEHDIHDTVLLLDGSGENDFDDVEFF